MLTIVERARAMGVETSSSKRWEQGMEHHEKSLEIFSAIEEIDFELCGDYFDWKSGSDGDNGEEIMYHMDIYFETLDREEAHKILPMG